MASAGVAAALENHLAEGYSAYSKAPAPAAADNEDVGGGGGGGPDPFEEDGFQPGLGGATSAFTNSSIDLTADPPNPDPADVSASYLARFDRAYFRRINITAKTVRVAYSGKEGRLDVAIGPGQAPFELMVRTPTLTCKWRPFIWPLGDNRVDNPKSLFNAEAHELYKARYNLAVAPHGTDDASMDTHGRNIHAVHFFNWCHRLTQLVHKRVCADLPQVVTFAGAKMRDAYNAIAKQRRDPFKTQEEAEAMFRDNGFVSPLKTVIDKTSGSYRENSEYMAFGGNVFQKISDKMKARYETEVPPMPTLHPTNAYPPSLYIHSLFNQRKEIEKTGPQMGKAKEGFIFRDVPLVLLRGPNGRPYLVPFEQRKGLLTERSVVSCLIGISFSISSKTGLLMMNTSLKRVTYCGENNRLPDGGGGLEDEMTWDTGALQSITLPPGFICDSAPTVTDVTSQLQIEAAAAAAPQKRKADGCEDDDDEEGLSDTERSQRRRTEPNTH